MEPTYNEQLMGKWHHDIQITESKELEHGLTGIEGVSWKPNDDRVLIYMLKALGFKHFKVLFKSAERKRLCVMASKLTPLAQP